MCRTTVRKSECYNNTAVLLTSHPGNNRSFYISNEEVDAAIQALTTYRDALPKPCVHAELIKQYAEDCQRYEKPWELWEALYKHPFDVTLWQTLTEHPNWRLCFKYRRKSGATS